MTDHQTPTAEELAAWEQESEEVGSLAHWFNAHIQYIRRTRRLIAALRADSLRLDWLDVPGHGVARHGDYAAAGDHTEPSSWARRGENVREAIDAARTTDPTTDHPRQAGESEP